MQVPLNATVDIRDGLVDALTLAELDEVLARLNVQRERVTTATNWDEAFLDVVKYFNRTSKIERLIITSRLKNPTNPQLAWLDERFLNGGVALADETAAPLGFASGSFQELSAGLEAMINPLLPMLDPRMWLSELSRAEARVCLIQAGGASGTGFLIGPDAVMTNYHVMEKVIGGSTSPGAVTLTFDRAMLADGRAVDPGTSFKLAANDWLIDYSEYHPSEKTNAPAGDIPVAAEKLDYAIVRVAGKPGEQPAGANASLQAAGMAEPRGYWSLPAAPHDFDSDKSLLILQYPCPSLPCPNQMKLAIDTNAYQRSNQSGTRVYYRTNTEPGSSGSPCFDLNWQPIALHHGSQQGQSNRGVPLPVIRQQLARRKKLSAIGA